MTDSRYRTPPHVTGPDAHGRITLAVDARPLPSAHGTYHHILSDGDRIDAVAAKYYGDPLAWWQISDANPETLSPWTLFGVEPLVTATLTAVPADTRSKPEPLWTALLTELGALPGVENVTVEDDEPLRSGGPHRLRITYNRLTRTEPLSQLLATAGFTVLDSAVSTRAGKAVVIPPGDR
jgi:hypothetical protein